MAMTFDPATYSESDKTLLRGLKATFVMAAREMSEARLTQLVKEYLAKGNVIFGVAKEAFVDGFDEQPQFRTLPLEPVEKLVEKIEKAHLPHSIRVITYRQQDVDEVIRAVRPQRVVVVRGSYIYPFHRRSTSQLLEKRNIPFEYVSPFVDEEQAKAYLAAVYLLMHTQKGSTFSDITEKDVMALVGEVAKESFDYSFQTGAVLAEKVGKQYQIIDAACNEVVPYQTFALHFGNAREIHRSAHQADAVHYDTIHAEMNLLVRAMKNGVNFEGKSLFINMMPCPNCARTLVNSGLKEMVYLETHSGDYAVELFEKAGIVTRKVEL